MATPDISFILQDLASGRIDAAEAGRRIDALSADPPPANPSPAEPSKGESSNTEPSDEDLVDAEDHPTDPWATETDRPQFAGKTTESFGTRSAKDEPDSAPTESKPEPVRPKPVNTNGVERISVRAVGRRVRILGETAVATLSADGPHVLRRNGSVLEVSSDGELGASLDGFSILRGVPRNVDDIRALGLGKELLLKVNPNIVVDVEVTAGSLHTERIPHLGKVRVTAGGAKLLDVTEINDALVQAGQATIKGAIKTGRNRIRAESGSLNITLADDSNVTITGDSQLGKVSWAGNHSGNVDEVVMGNGSARLDVEVVMGHAQIRAGSDQGSGNDK